MRLPLLSLAVAASAFAQPVTFGVRVGEPLTDFASTVQSALGSGNNVSLNQRPYILGPTVELRLPAGLGIELDALYRRQNYTETIVTANPPTTQTTTFTSTSADAWEFPLLGKYRFGPKLIHPFFDAGIAFDSLQGLSQTVKNTVDNITNASSSGTPSQLLHSTVHGYVFGGGLDIKFLVIHIQPEIRYTRWGAKQFFSVSGWLNSNQNQAEFLLGITF